MTARRGARVRMGKEEGGKAGGREGNGRAEKAELPQRGLLGREGRGGGGRCAS
jgi:hypothetical protein